MKPHSLRPVWFALGAAMLNATGVAGVTSGKETAQARLAPDFTATTIDGKTLRLHDQIGKVVLLDFWGAWCGPCRDAAPDLGAMYDRHVNEPFVIIGISSDSASDAGSLREFVSSNRLKWPQVHDLSQDVIHKYAVNVYPTYVLIDGDGVERARFDGRSSVKDVDTAVRKWLQRLAAENARQERAVVPATIAAPSPKAPPRERSSLPPALSGLLGRAGRYVEDYERQISMVVAEELYVQTSTASSSSGTETRTLKSDILVVDLGMSGWIGFRDVFEVDGQPVRDHQNRLLALVMSPSPDPLTQARRMAEQGARFNLGALTRTINMPTVALKFLRPVNQGRSSWKAGARKKIDGHEVVELTFSEEATPRMIETGDQAAARGRFWIEEATGRIVRTELGVETVGVRATVTVTFGPSENLVPWVPLSLDDEYKPVNTRTPNYGPSRVDIDAMPSDRLGPGGSIDGHATYGKFRAFDVTSNTVIKKR